MKLSIDIHCYSNVWRCICTAWRVIMPSLGDYHNVALVLGTIVRSIDCVQLQLPSGNLPLVELKVYKANYDIFSILWYQLHLHFPLQGVLVAMLDGCTVGATWELLSLVQDAQGLTGKSGVCCESNAQHRKLTSPRVLNLIRCLAVFQDEGWAILCSLSNKTQDMNPNHDISQVEPRNCRNSRIYIFFFLPTPPFSIPPVIYTPSASCAISTSRDLYKIMPLVPKHTR